jgi:hypothetical protein
MRGDLPTEAEVAYLLKAKKFVHSCTKDTTNSGNSIPMIEVMYSIRRADAPKDDDLRLKFWARRERPVLVTGPKPRPGASLLWRGHRIRGIARRIKHGSIRNGILIEEIRGWYEHQWTNTDQDKYCVGIGSEMKQVQEDFWSVVRFCLTRWNIETKADQSNQGALKFGR